MFVIGLLSSDSFVNDLMLQFGAHTSTIREKMNQAIRKKAKSNEETRKKASTIKQYYQTSETIEEDPEHPNAEGRPLLYAQE